MSWLEGCSRFWHCSGRKVRFAPGAETLRIGWSGQRRFWLCLWRFFPILHFDSRGACNSSKQHDKTY